MFVQDWKVQQLRRFGARGVSPDIRKMQLQRITEAVEQQPRELTREAKSETAGQSPSAVHRSFVTQHFCATPTGRRSRDRLDEQAVRSFDPVGIYSAHSHPGSGRVAIHVKLLVYETKPCLRPYRRSTQPSVFLSTKNT